MKRRTILAVAVALVLLVGVTGAATAQPGGGPPDELPSPVPDFVTDILETISDFLNGVITSLGSAINSLTPGSWVAPIGTDGR